MTTTVSVFSHPGDGLVCSVERHTWDVAKGGDVVLAGTEVVPSGETRQYHAFPGQLITVEECSQAEHDAKVPAVAGSTGDGEAA